MTNNERPDAVKEKCTVGGQALIEGIMMRGPRLTATVVRKTGGELVEKTMENSSPKDKFPPLGWPVIRGVVNMITSMVVGMKEITYSASFFEDEPDDAKEPNAEPLTEDEKVRREKRDKRNEGFLMAGAIILSLLISVALFFFLPTFLVSLYPGDMPSFVMSLTEGVVRIAILVLYIFLISRTKDIKRVFMYHGAEHKTIFTYEQGDELTVENVRKRSRFHPRCGTNFLFIVMIVSILVFAFVRWEDVLLRFAMRIVLIPLVVGISYEFIMLSAKHDNFFTRLMCMPGLWLQRLTTKEPDDSMIEVAIAATRLALEWDEPGQHSCEGEAGAEGAKGVPAVSEGDAQA